MTVTRREVVLAGIGFGVAFAAGSALRAPAGQGPVTSALSVWCRPAAPPTRQRCCRRAVDAAAWSGLPLFLPPGTYSTRRLELRSGSHLTGVPGRSILRCRDGGGLISIEHAKDIRLEGLVLDGGGKDMGVNGALLVGHDGRAASARELPLPALRLGRHPRLALPRMWSSPATSSTRLRPASP